MSDELKAYYEYQACLLEPWDGPASMAFTDGTVIGAALDRNGLRPSRYWVTKNGLVVMASEAGVLALPPDQVESKGRLRPGRMFLVDTAQGRIIADDEIKTGLAARHPYRQWLNENQVTLDDLPAVAGVNGHLDEPLLKLQRAFGYTLEDLRILIGPMATDGHEPIGSMGNDTPLAVLSDRPQLLLQLLQATVRAGHQSAARRDSRRDHHLADHDDRLRRQPARRNARAMPAAAAGRADHHQRRTGEDQGARRRRACAAARLSMLFPRSEGAAGHGAAVEGVARRSRARRSPRASPILVLSRSRRESRERADSGAAGRQQRASSPGARRNPHALRPRDRNRRSPRGASLRPADRLRRRRGESVSGAGDARRHARRALSAGDLHPQEAAKELPQGRRSRACSR